jgi:hypothetical protein
VHRPAFVTPAIRFPAFTAVGASALTLTAMKIKKAVKDVLKERKKQKDLRKQQELWKQQGLRKRQELRRRKELQRRKAGGPNGEAQARTGSSEPSPRQDPKRLRSRPLPHTRLRPGLYHPRLG